MSCYKRQHVNIFICIEMARERNWIINKKNTLYIGSIIFLAQPAKLKYQVLCAKRVKFHFDNSLIIHLFLFTLLLLFPQYTSDYNADADACECFCLKDFAPDQQVTNFLIV